jgi:acyl-CoA synthetase (AMP-forming)/AMP-acid ligase II
MTEVLPDMDPTRPAEVNPLRILEAFHDFHITNMFGSPALINRLAGYGEPRGVRLPYLRRVISAGAPVPAKVLERFSAMLPSEAQIFTPYGATECLPVSSIGSVEILGETRLLTEQGKGVCVGRPVPGLTVKIIRITDGPILSWNDSIELKPGDIGEIAVKGVNATAMYHERPEATQMAKIQDRQNGGFYHRMGDVGYIDESGRIWFCGRKSHRVITSQGPMFTIPCEAVFNAHPSVYRTALIGVKKEGVMEPVICVELDPSAQRQPKSEIQSQLLAIAAKHSHTQSIKTFLFHPRFPVDIRHNAKIFREKLALWAGKQSL